MSDLSEVTEAVKSMGVSWETFKKSNGERLDAIELDIVRSKRPKVGGPAPDTAEFRDMATGQEIKAIGIEHVGRVHEVLGSGERTGTLGDFVRAVAGMRAPAEMKASVAAGSDATGGYAVPNFLFGDFIEALAPASSVTQAGARILPLTNSAKTFRIAKVGTIPTAAWRSEAGPVAESDPAFEAVDLTPRSLAFYFKASRESLADGSNIDAMLRKAIAQAFAKEIDRAALRGSGTPPEPRGILNTSGIGAIANGAAGATLSSLKWSNLLAAYSTILAADAPPPTAAIMAPRSLVGYASLVDTPGQPLQRPFLLEPLKFIATSQIPTNLTVTTSTDCSEIFVGDFTQLVLGVREDVSIMVADQLFATTGQIAFVCHARVDIALVHAAAFCKITGIRAG